MKNPISSIKEKVIQYIQLRFELLRLEVVERLVNVMGYFAFIIICMFLFFATAFFFFLGIAELLNQIFDSYALGYFCTSAIVLIISTCIVLCSKRIIRFFAGKMAWLLTKQKDGKKDEEEEAE